MTDVDPHACLAQACASRFPAAECDPPSGCVLKGVLAAVTARPGVDAWPRLNEASEAGNALIEALAEAGLIRFEIDGKGSLRAWPALVVEGGDVT